MHLSQRDRARLDTGLPEDRGYRSVFWRSLTAPAASQWQLSLRSFASCSYPSTAHAMRARDRIDNGDLFAIGRLTRSCRMTYFNRKSLIHGRQKGLPLNTLPQSTKVLAIPGRKTQDLDLRPDGLEGQLFSPDVVKITVRIRQACAYRPGAVYPAIQ
jgi:hypothetical protein